MLYLYQEPVVDQRVMRANFFRVGFFFDGFKVVLLLLLFYNLD